MFKEMTASVLFLFIISISCLSCNHEKNSQFNLEMQKANCCGFHQDIYKTRTGGLGSAFLYIQEITNYGVLKDISSGVDSFELRIWYPSIVDTTDVFVLKYDQEWQCQIYKHIREVTKKGELKNNWQIKRNCTAEIKINSLLDSLAQKNLFLLKDCHNLTGYDFATDDAEVIFEIAGSDFYRFASYSGLMRQSEKYPEVAAAKSIIRFLDREFETDIVKGISTRIW